MGEAKPVTVEWNGEIYRAHYEVDGDAVIVKTATAELSERGGDLAPLMTARRLLLSFARKEHA